MENPKRRLARATVNTRLVTAFPRDPASAIRRARAEPQRARLPVLRIVVVAPSGHLHGRPSDAHGIGMPPGGSNCMTMR